MRLDLREIARRVGASLTELELPMASRSGMETRIRMIMNQAKRRGSITMAAIFTLGIGFSTVVCAMCAWSLVPQRLEAAVAKLLPASVTHSIQTLEPLAVTASVPRETELDSKPIQALRPEAPAGGEVADDPSEPAAEPKIDSTQEAVWTPIVSATSIVHQAVMEPVQAKSQDKSRAEMRAAMRKLNRGLSKFLLSMTTYRIDRTGTLSDAELRELWVGVIPPDRYARVQQVLAKGGATGELDTPFHLSDGGNFGFRIGSNPRVPLSFAVRQNLDDSVTFNVGWQDAPTKLPVGEKTLVTPHVGDHFCLTLDTGDPHSWTVLLFGLERNPEYDPEAQHKWMESITASQQAKGGSTPSAPPVSNEMDGPSPVAYHAEMFHIKADPGSKHWWDGRHTPPSGFTWFSEPVEKVQSMRAELIRASATDETSLLQPSSSGSPGDWIVLSPKDQQEISVHATRPRKVNVNIHGAPEGVHEFGFDVWVKELPKDSTSGTASGSFGAMLPSQRGVLLSRRADGSLEVLFLWVDFAESPAKPATQEGVGHP